MKRKSKIRAGWLRFFVLSFIFDFCFLSALRIIIRLCESSRHPTKGKHHFYICQNGSLKFCRINGENPDKIGVFTGYIYFVALLQREKDSNPHIRSQSLL